MNIATVLREGIGYFLQPIKGLFNPRVSVEVLWANVF